MGSQGTFFIAFTPAGCCTSWARTDWMSQPARRKSNHGIACGEGGLNERCRSTSSSRCMLTNWSSVVISLTDTLWIYKTYFQGHLVLVFNNLSLLKERCPNWVSAPLIRTLSGWTCTTSSGKMGEKRSIWKEWNAMHKPTDFTGYTSSNTSI